MKCNKFLCLIVQSEISLNFSSDFKVFQNNEVKVLIKANVLKNEGNKFFCINGFESNKIKKEYLSNKRLKLENITTTYNGFIYDNDSNQLVFFVDHLSSIPLYKYERDGIIIIGMSVLDILNVLKKLDIKVELFYDAALTMCSLGYMLDNITLVNDIKKISHSNIIYYNLENLEKKIEVTFSYDIQQKVDMHYNEIKNKIDILFKESIEKSVPTNNEKVLNHLSGGLDSRVTLLCGKKLGYNPQKVLTVAKTTSLDAQIAIEITNKYNLNHILFSSYKEILTEEKILDLVNETEGLVQFSGASHMSNAYKNLNFKAFDYILTGQIGDIVFGSAIRDYKEFNMFDYLKAISMLKKIDVFKEVKLFNSIAKRYNNQKYELFAYEQRQINGTLNGDRIIQCKKFTYSPFYDKNLISFMLSVPHKYKLHQKVYIDWIKSNNPEVLNFKWQKINAKPTSNNKIKIMKYIKKYTKTDFDMLSNVSEESLKNYTEIFEKYISKIENKSLKNILLDEFEHGSISLKERILTVVLFNKEYLI